MSTTAGHVWQSDGRCSCGKRLTDISFAAYGEEWVGQGGIAHSGNLTDTEQNEIRDEVERIFDATMEGGQV